MLPVCAKNHFLVRDFNCSETILRAANDYYDLNLDEKCLMIMAGFGGGMGIESTCGALTGSIAVLSVIFTRGKAHESPWVKELCREFMETFRRRHGNIECTPLKEQYRKNEEERCLPVITMATALLQEIVERELREWNGYNGPDLVTETEA